MLNGRVLEIRWVLDMRPPTRPESEQDSLGQAFLFQVNNSPRPGRQDNFSLSLIQQPNSMQYSHRVSCLSKVKNDDRVSRP